MTVLPVASTSTSAGGAVDAAEAVDRQFLLRAVELAWQGWGRVHPNPMVGAVVVRSGEVVAEGWHGEYGGPHAEVSALEAAGERARGATVYVSLEPCAHHGKTPPCTEALIDAGVTRVVYGAADPTPEAGGGAGRLRAAGIRVDGALAELEVRRQNAAFFHHAERRTTFVAVKLAITLDAKLTRAIGEQSQISGEQAEQEVHRLRAGFDAIMVGAETALVDDPLLTVRGPLAPRRSPARIVLDSRLRLSPSARMLHHGDGPVIVFCGEGAARHAQLALEAAGAQVVAVPPAPEGGLALEAILQVCRARELRTVLCEGGGRLATALLRGRHARRLYLLVAPRVAGPNGVPAFVGAWGDEELAGWTAVETRRLGADALIVLDWEP